MVSEATAYSVKREGVKMIKVIIPGRPVPKTRPRLGVRGRTAYVYTPPQTKEYEKLVGWVAKAAGCKPGDTRVAVAIDIFTRRKMDVDNVAKSVLDGLNGIAYEDDDQVVELLVRKHQARDAVEERVEIEIRESGRPGRADDGQRAVKTAAAPKKRDQDAQAADQGIGK